MAPDSHQQLIQGLRRTRGDLVKTERALRAEAGACAAAISRIDQCLAKVSA